MNERPRAQKQHDLQTSAAPPQTFLLTVRQVSAQLQVSTRTVNRLISAGKLPVLHIGRSVRIRAEDLAALLRQK